jgi:hypothetical protein
MELSFGEGRCNAIRGEFRCGVANKVARWECDFKKVRPSRSPHLTASDILFLGVLNVGF